MIPAGEISPHLDIENLERQVNAMEPGFLTATQVACFHETDGAPQNWPIDVEIVRRTIKENLEA
jgi:hypothetical protein